MCVLNLQAGYTAIDWHGGVVYDAMLPAIATLPRFVAIWFYWNGYSWARAIVLISSVAVLWNLTAWTHVNTFARIVIALKVALGLFLLYWLNTRGIRRFFDPRPTTLL